MLDRDYGRRPGPVSDDWDNRSAQESFPLPREQASVADDESRPQHHFAVVQEGLLGAVLRLSVLGSRIGARGVGTQEHLATDGARLRSVEDRAGAFNVALHRAVLEVVGCVDDDIDIFEDTRVHWL